MQSTIRTPRLELSLLTRLDRGSEELGWLHELRSDKGSTAWSIYAPSATIEDTLKIAGNYIPSNSSSSPSNTNTKSETNDNSRHRLAYAVHLPPQPNTPRTFLGLITLLPVSPTHLPLPSALVIPAEKESTTLVVELAYAFLPRAWGSGYATESLTGLLDALHAHEGDFWKPWDKVWMRVIVNGRNPASVAVMRKLVPCGVSERGVHVWKGEAIFIGGEWRTEDDLVIFGGWVKGGEE